MRFGILLILGLSAMGVKFSKEQGAFDLELATTSDRAVTVDGLTEDDATQTFDRRLNPVSFSVDAASLVGTITVRGKPVVANPRALFSIRVVR